MKIDAQLKEEFKKYMLSQLSQVNGMPVVKISAAYELSPQEVEMLKKKFSILRHAKIIIEVQPELMAGFVIKYGSKMIDVSLRAELLKLQKTLYESA